MGKTAVPGQRVAARKTQKTLKVQTIRARAAKAPRKVYPAENDPKVEALVREIIERVADKWTMLVLEALEEHGVVRFTRLGELVGDISQKMLTKTVRQMERDGLLKRTIHPVIPPRVEYELTELGKSLSEAFCGVWMWAAAHQGEIAHARTAFGTRVL
jgi:DNA-binding HxlR family transcriptional regulator